jgi:hypothetical protein
MDLFSPLTVRSVRSGQPRQRSMGKTNKQSSINQSINQSRGNDDEKRVLALSAAIKSSQ